MISILNELTLEIGDAITEEEVTLWLVSYSGKPSLTWQEQASAFVIALSEWCLTQGWELYSGADPYQEKSLRVFGGDGFSLPDPEPGR